jgi:hypothetical protein
MLSTSDVTARYVEDAANSTSLVIFCFDVMLISLQAYLTKIRLQNPPHCRLNHRLPTTLTASSP